MPSLAVVLCAKRSSWLPIVVGALQIKSGNDGATSDEVTVGYLHDLDGLTKRFRCLLKCLARRRN